MIAAQTSVNPMELPEWMSNCIYGGHAFDTGVRPFEREDTRTGLCRLGAKMGKLQPWIKEYPPAADVSCAAPVVNGSRCHQYRGSTRWRVAKGRTRTSGRRGGGGKGRGSRVLRY